MSTALGIILADLLLFVFYVCQYRQELGLAVNGSNDGPPARRKPARTGGSTPGPPAGPPAARSPQAIVRP